MDLFVDFLPQNWWFDEVGLVYFAVVVEGCGDEFVGNVYEYLKYGTLQIFLIPKLW